MYKLLPILLFAYGLALTTEDIYDNSYALIIGIDKYKNKSLDYAVKDAESVATLLKDKFNFPQTNIKTLLNEEATFLNIRNSLSEIASSAKENDRVLIYFAGHGVTDILPDGGEMGYLLPIDGKVDNLFATSIPMDDIKRISSISKSKHMLFLVDACYGGLSAVGARGLDATTTPNYIDKITKDKARQIITAGGRGEQVVEKSEWGHSAFTMNLIRALEDGKADLNDDGYITAEELGVFLKDKVTIDSGNQQTPVSRRFTSQEGEFVFINNAYIAKQIINIPSKTENNVADLNELKDEIALLKEELKKPVHFKQGCTNTLAENYNPEANFDDGSCIILKVNDAYIRFGNFNDKDSLLDIYIKTGVSSSRIFEIELLTRGFVISELIDGLVDYKRNRKGEDGDPLEYIQEMGNNHMWLFSNSGINANYGEELLLRAKVEPTSNEFCIDKISISNYYVFIDECLTKLDVDISFPVTSFQTDSINSIYLMGIDYKEFLLRMGINVFLSDITIPLEYYYVLEINVTNTLSTGEELEGQIVFEEAHDNSIYDLGDFTSTNEYMELAELKNKEVEGVFDLQINEHPFNLNVNINNYISGSKICIKNAVIYYNNDDYEYNFENKIPLSSGFCIEMQ